MNKEAVNTMHDIPLGKQTEYVSVYTPSLLCPIPREESRRSLSIDEQALPFSGVDIWTGYELSWLDAKGKPVVAMAEFIFPCFSPAIVESKSFKLYLNSFNQTRFNSMQEVATTLESDLSVAAGAKVLVDVQSLNQGVSRGLGHLVGESIDGQDIEVDVYHPDASLLACDEGRIISENLHSDLLKSNCPVTGQPDWASVYIAYRGPAIDKAALLRYIVSFREHQDFHEHCVERMFTDIKAQCKPEQLTVYARYTRRGGLDINPFRTDCGDSALDIRLARQ
ncbi:NADPH-dependent 7-cyano-7-deazaguanine reductase QueF [Maricurvus nonylphenolicus]|uniref:NADPH-dependent 7-cyano-7-deazaguanine reductase QueF n=1 Tax=Maricurvus nonylphenolicus TaxID=1008307 RepID=UPI0036F3866B